MKNKETYNGYTNRETWALSLWLNNTEGDYNYWIEQAKEALENNDTEQHAKWAVVQQLKELIDDIGNNILSNPEQTTKPQRSMFLDIGNVSIIDFYEVAQEFIDTVKENEAIKESN